MAVLSVGSPALADRVLVQANAGSLQPEGKAEGSFTDLLGTVQKSQTVTDLPVSSRAADTGNGSNRKPKTAGTEDKAPVAEQKAEEKPKTENGKQAENSGTNTETKETAEGTEKTAEETKGAVTEKAQKLLKEVAAILDIPEEELEGLLETLGLTAMDLLNPKVIPQVVAEETGNDISAVIADENLYETVQEITTLTRQAGEELQSELNLRPEEFVETMTRITGKPEEAELEAETETEAKAPEELKNNLIQDGSIEDADTTFEETVRTPAEAVKSERKELEPDRQPEENEGLKVVADRTESTHEADRADTGGREEGGAHARHDSSDSTPQVNLFQQNLTNAVENAVSGIESNFTSSYTDVEHIINQIENEIRVRITDVSQSLEMQLNPANLGRVEMHLTMKAGALTAQFEAENSHVREVMQSQAAELKQNLEQQGIRVESVEVTLRERGFEQNFMQENNQAGEQAMEEARKQQSRRMRRILFDDDAEEGDLSVEGMTEAEQLTRRMMELSGNRLDFQA
ncbi:MAG: flagellar hook-length control protein FliK [Lachnospiraceae bacterium]|nr:flagellar hook-length control protein FliK [Lachnospiraceae bacterium]